MDFTITDRLTRFTDSRCVRPKHQRHLLQGCFTDFKPRRQDWHITPARADCRYRAPPGTERNHARCCKRTLSKRNDVEIYGFQDGYKGLIYSNFEMLTAKDFSGILTMGGTILGTSRQPFKLMRVPGPDGIDKVEAMKHTYHKLNLNCLVVLGGNGTHKTANLLREEGLNMITLPKTIDNDIWGTDMTFGFQSAVDIATEAIDRIHTTATSHSRVFIVEVMGHKVGWVTLHAGIAGGADIILLPEIPYDVDNVVRAIKSRTRQESILRSSRLQKARSQKKMQPFRRKKN